MKFGNPGERLRKKRWNLDELPKFEKNFYTEHPEVQRMSQVSLYILSTHAQNSSKTLTKRCYAAALLLISPVVTAFRCNLVLIFIFCSCLHVQYELEEFRRKKEITIRGTGCPKAILAFHQAQFPR